MKIQIKKILCSKDSASKSLLGGNEWHVSFNISHDFSCSACSNGTTGNGNKVIYISNNLPCGSCRLAESMSVIFISGELMPGTQYMIFKAVGSLLFLHYTTVWGTI